MPDRKLMFKVVGLVLGLCLFGWIVLDAVEKSQSTEWPPLPMLNLGFAVLIVIVAHGLHGLAWTVGARELAPRLGWGDGIAAYSISFMARYIPGKLWQIGGLSFLVRDKGGEPLAVAGYSLLFLVAFQALGALTMMVAYLFRYSEWDWLITLLATPLMALSLAVPYHLLGGPVINLLPEKIRRQLEATAQQPFDALMINLTLLATVWVLLASSGHALVTGFEPDWDGTWGQCAVAVIGGLIAGFLVLIAPSGAGVRESTIAVWLTSMGVLPLTSIAIVIALRIVMTAGELLWAAAGMLLALRKSSN